VRVGLASIKGLAEAMGKPAAGISNLRAIASFGTAPLRAPVLDARRGEVYAAIYDAAGVLVQQETVGKFESWLAALPESGIEILSPDYAAEGVPIVRTPRELAAAVARLAPSEAGDPAALDANYVRRSDAELFWKEW
jgi:tRNA threonylcarbamoyladenosine biosynthesis protein TsaB